MTGSSCMYMFNVSRRCQIVIHSIRTNLHFHHQQISVPVRPQLRLFQRLSCMVERHNAGEIDSKGCCKILRKDATAVGYLFIHSSNNYLMKICYISGTVLGSGNTAVKGWREFLSSWGLQSIGKRSIHCQNCTTHTKPLFSDFHPNSGIQMDFLQVLSNFFLATVFRAPVNLTGFPGGGLTTWTSRCIQIPKLQCSSWRSIGVGTGSLQLDNSGFLIYHLNLSCCKR